VEGFVLDVDAEEGFLALEGETLELAEQVRRYFSTDACYRNLVT